MFFPLHANASGTEKYQAGVVVTSSGSLNVRSSPTVQGNVLSALPKGSYVTLHSQNGSWWKVEYAAGKYGYCHKDYIQTTAGTSAVVATSSGQLNVRNGGGTGYTKIGALRKGESVIVLSSGNGWSRILYHGTKTGYVSAQYLSARFAAASVWVPNLKQNDPRWADKTIGVSGKTFAQIGCATTGIAMMESARNGNTITPDDISVSLRYTATGNVYWPDNYKIVTSESSLLNAVYELLKQGKPVLLGRKNTYGAQHWVVITGFTGGESLEADRFLIHDPGTYSRTTLKDFLIAYPIFYKYFYY